MTDCDRGESPTAVAKESFIRIPSYGTHFPITAPSRSLPLTKYLLAPRRVRCSEGSRFLITYIDEYPNSIEKEREADLKVIITYIN